MKFINRKCLIYSNNRLNSVLITQKLLDLGVIQTSFFDNENEFLEATSLNYIDSILLIESEQESEINNILESIRKNNRNSEVIVISTISSLSYRDTFVLNFDELMKLEREVLPLEYVSISIEENMKFNSSPCDIYVKIRPNKLLKLVNKGEELSHIELEKYWSQSTEYLFILKEDVSKFYKVIVSNFIKKIEDGLDKEELIYVSSLIESLIPISVSLKFPESIIRSIVDGHIDVYREISSKFDIEKLASLNEEDKSLLDRRMLSSLISTLILKNLPWRSTSVHNKIVMCSLFHDVSLRGLAFDSVETAELDNLSQDFNEFKQHPFKSAEMIDGNHFIDNDVITMIKQHHEEGDGSGFPRGLINTKISKLSCIFILSEKVSESLLNQERIDFDNLKKVVDKINEENKNGNFSEIYYALKRGIEDCV